MSTYSKSDVAAGANLILHLDQLRTDSIFEGISDELADKIVDDIKADIVADVQHEMERIAKQNGNHEWQRDAETEINAACYCAELLIEQLWHKDREAYEEQVAKWRKKPDAEQDTDEDGVPW